jgi:hypothetical protein
MHTFFGKHVGEQIQSNAPQNQSPPVFDHTLVAHVGYDFAFIIS